MRITVWVPDRLVEGLIGPTLLLSGVELPILVTSLSLVDPSQIWPQGSLSAGFPSGGPVLAFLVFLSFVVGYATKDARRAIQIYVASQFLVFASSIAILFVYPVTSQAYLAMAGCLGPSCLQNEQLLSLLFEYIAGYAIVTVLAGFVTAAFGSFIGERINGRSLS